MQSAESSKTKAYIPAETNSHKNPLKVHPTLKKKKTLKEAVDKQVWKYLNRQKKFQTEDSNRRRAKMAKTVAEEVMEDTQKLKRKLTETPPNKSPTDKRPAISELKMKQSIRLIENYLMKTRKRKAATTKKQKKTLKERKHKKMIPDIKKEYTADINSYKNLFANKLLQRYAIQICSASRFAQNQILL
ncbi:hypothetical protein GN244_ATG14474 [Phytophthora infestans]|uniref:Uncharacterized protein n=1 Tax=Phytophthora infestans TaxID=4787 RepID=A0A833WQ86_PHYIN|nr:hypothetical protein GN244_ATG14474 [Phytophthora infestans]